MEKKIGFGKSLLFTATSLLLIIAVAITVTEVILRFLNGSWTQANYLNVIRDRHVEIRVNDIYEFERDTVDYTRDSYGLRGGCTDPADIEILTIGGSTTDQKVVDDKLTYQQRMQERLSEHYKREICVSNAGVDGHSTFGHIAAFEHWLPLIEDLSPSFVLLYVGINDASFERLDGSARGFDYDTKSGVKSYLKSFEIVHAFVRAKRIVQGLLAQNAYGSGHHRIDTIDYVEATLSEQTESLARRNAERFERNFSELLKSVQEMGARPICVTQPHFLSVKIEGVPRGISEAFHYDGRVFNGLDYDFSLQLINGVVRRLCGENHFIDLYSHPFERTLFYDHTHTKAEGAQVVGDVISDQLIELELLEK